MSARPEDPGPDPSKHAINARAYVDLLLHIMPIANLGLARPRIYTASRNSPVLKNHAGCVAAVETWLRKLDRDIDDENKPDFLTVTCSPLAEVWLKTWRAGVAAGHREEIVDALATHFRVVDHPELLPQRTAAATSHARDSRELALNMEAAEPPAKRALQ